MTRERIIFLKSVEFLDIKENNIFDVYYDYDKRPFIKLKTRMKIYLTNKRYALGYFKLLHSPVKIKKLSEQEKEEFIEECMKVFK